MMSKGIRQLWLQNAQGERIPLNGQTSIYAYDLHGLGFSLSPKFADLGYGFFAAVADANDPQGSPGMTLVFTKNPYDVYQRFINWLAVSGNAVTLVYQPTGSQEFLTDVTIASLQKAELDEVGWLRCPITFYASSPWYRPLPTTFDMESTASDNSKRYDYIYEDLIYGDDSASVLSVDLVGAGHLPGALELTYHGPISNPRIRIAGSRSGKNVALCSAKTILAPSDTLHYSSRQNDSHLYKVSAAGEVTDLLDVLDLSTNPFGHIPINEPCTVSLEADSAIVGRAELTIYYHYRSV